MRPFRDAASYVAAIIDGEGSVDSDGRAVKIHNTDLSIIQACEQCLAELGVEFTRRWRPARQPGWKDSYLVCISGRRNLQILGDKLPLADTKRRRLEMALSTYQLVHHRRDQIPEDELRHAYGTGIRGRALADRFGVSTSTVYGWMERIGLSRRGRWA